MGISNKLEIVIPFFQPNSSRLNKLKEIEYLENISRKR